MRELLKKMSPIIPILGFVFLIGMIFYLLYSENSDLHSEIEELNSELIKKDSIIEDLDTNLLQYQNLVDEIKMDHYKCPPIYGYKLNGKSLSTEELLDELLFNWNLVDSLKLEIELRNNFLKEIETNWGIKIINEKNSYAIVTPKDSRIAKNERKLNDLEFILGELKIRYGFKYELKTEKNENTLVFNFNKLDSALLLYPYFKDRIKKEKNYFIVTH